MSLSRAHSFWLMCLIAIILPLFPYVHWPFTWMMTFFHEISHGLAAIFSGGKILYMQMHINGAGLCVTLGGYNILIMLSGYLGAVLWGVLIFEFARLKAAIWFYVFSIFLYGILIATLALWAKGVVTYMIIFILLLFMVFVAQYQKNNATSYLAKFMGLFIVLDAIKAPFYLLDGKHVGDAASLSDITNIPEYGWVMMWVGFGVAALIFMYKNHIKMPT